MTDVLVFGWEGSQSPAPPLSHLGPVEAAGLVAFWRVAHGESTWFENVLVVGFFVGVGGFDPSDKSSEQAKRSASDLQGAEVRMAGRDRRDHRPCGRSRDRGSWAIGVGIAIGMVVGAAIGAVLRAANKPES